MRTIPMLMFCQKMMTSSFARWLGIPFGRPTGRERGALGGLGTNLRHRPGSPGSPGSPGCWVSDEYPLVMTNIAMENGKGSSEYHGILWLSIVYLPSGNLT